MFHVFKPAAIVLATAVVLAGCSKSPSERIAETAIEQAAGGDVQVDQDGNQVSLRTDQGDMTLSADEALPLPADFPGDVYLPGNYQVNSVMDMGKVRAVSLRTPLPVSQLFAEAGTAMKAQGWTQKMAMQQAAGNAILSFEKDTPDKITRTVSLSFIQSKNAGDGTIVSVQMQQSGQ